MRATTALQTFRILVSDPLSDGGLGRLKAAPDAEVTAPGKMERADLLEAIAGQDALIVRSETEVDDELLVRAKGLRVVGRAGVGLDNVDVEAATARGVMVVNAPQSNVLTTAEHTMAMLLAVARNIPQAHAALTAGRWERSKWEGVELADKTLGIIGLGRIGKLVAQRASAFGMRIVAHDPFVSADAAKKLNIDLLSLDELAAEADFVTLHVVKTPETVGMIGAGYLATAQMVRQILMVLVVAPLLLYATPSGLAVRLVGWGRRLGFLRLTARTFVAIPVAALALLAVNAPALVDPLVRTPYGAFALDAIWIAAGFVLWMPVQCPHPGVRRLEGPPALAYLILQSIVPVLPGFWMTWATTPLHRVYELAPRVFDGFDPVSDQQAAAAVGRCWSKGAATIAARSRRSTSSRPRRGCPPRSACVSCAAAICASRTKRRGRRLPSSTRRWRERSGRMAIRSAAGSG